MDLHTVWSFGLGLLLAQASLIILPGEAGAAVRASASLDAKNCLFHALARTYAHFFISILYVNFQFGSNEYSDYLALAPYHLLWSDFDVPGFFSKIAIVWQDA